MEIFMRILKETGIAIIVLALVTFIIWVMFNDQLPFLGQAIPNPVEYAEVNPSDFDIEGNIEGETNPTLTWEVTQGQSQGFENDRYVSTGGVNPFNSNKAESDVPSERVTIANSANGGNSYSSTSGDSYVSDDSGVKSLE